MVSVQKFVALIIHLCLFRLRLLITGLLLIECRESRIEELVNVNNIGLSGLSCLCLAFLYASYCSTKLDLCFFTVLSISSCYFSCSVVASVTFY